MAAAAKPIDEWLLQVISAEVAMRAELERKNQELQVEGGGWRARGFL